MQHPIPNTTVAHGIRGPCTPRPFAAAFLLACLTAPAVAQTNGVPQTMTLAYPAVTFSPATKSFESTLPYATPFFVEVKLGHKESDGLIVAWTSTAAPCTPVSEAPKNETAADKAKREAAAAKKKASCLAELADALAKRDCDAVRSKLPKVSCAASERPYKREKEADTWRVLVKGDAGHLEDHEGLEFRQNYTFFVDYGQRRYSKARVKAYLDRLTKGIDGAIDAASTKLSGPAGETEAGIATITSELGSALTRIAQGDDATDAAFAATIDGSRAQYATVMGDAWKSHRMARTALNPQAVDQLFTDLYAIPGFAAGIVHPSSPLLGGYSRADLVRAFDKWGTFDPTTRRRILDGSVDLRPDEKKGTVWKTLRDGYPRPVALCHLVTLVAQDTREAVQVLAPRVAAAGLSRSDCHSTPTAGSYWSHHAEAWRHRRSASALRKTMATTLAGTGSATSAPLDEFVAPRAIALDDPNKVMLTADLGIGGVFLPAHDHRNGQLLTPMLGVNLAFVPEDKRLPLRLGWGGRHSDLLRRTSLVFGVTVARLKDSGRAVRGLISDQVTPYFGAGYRLSTSMRVSAGVLAAETQSSAPFSDEWTITAGGFVRASIDLDVYNLVRELISAF